jgi:hypothetical protein
MDSTLVVVDSLMWSRPDSAFVLLQERFSPDDPYAQLLLAELLYKNDYAQTNRGKVLNIVDSFSATPFLSARAHYINGVGYYENDSVVEACREYLNALKVMEDRYEDSELMDNTGYFIAMALTRLTDLFSDMYLHKQAISFGLRSIPYYEQYAIQPWHLPWMLNKIGTQYNIIGALDSADYYFQRALECLPDTNCMMYRDIVTHQAFLSYMLGDSPSLALSRLYQMLDQAENEKERHSRCMTIGDILYHENLYDSATVYLSAAFHESDQISFKKQTAEWLAEICKRQHKDSELQEYIAFLAPFANKDEEGGALKSQLSALCQDFELDRREAQHQKKAEKRLKWVVLVLTFAAAFVLLSLILLYANKKRKGIIVSEKTEAEKAKIALHKAKEEITHLQTINRALNELNGVMNSPTAWPKTAEEKYEAMIREDVCTGIMEKLRTANTLTSFDVKDYPNLALSSKELSALAQVIYTYCPEFFIRLKMQYPKLNAKDIVLCRLYLLNLKVLQVAILLGTDYSSVRKRTHRLKEKMGCEDLCLKLKQIFLSTVPI